VSNLKKELKTKNGIKFPDKLITKNGKEMNVSKIGGKGGRKPKKSKAEPDQPKPEQANVTGEATSEQPSFQGLSENEIFKAKDHIISVKAGLKALDGVISPSKWDEATINKFKKTWSGLATEWTKLALLMTELEEKVQMAESE
jgi:hypothetical protein